MDCLHLNHYKTSIMIYYTQVIYPIVIARFHCPTIKLLLFLLLLLLLLLLLRSLGDHGSRSPVRLVHVEVGATFSEKMANPFAVRR